MGRSSGLGGIIEGVTGRGKGIPMPIIPTESMGIMSGSQRPKKNNRRNAILGVRSFTAKDPKTGLLYGSTQKFNPETGKYENLDKIPTREELDARAAERDKNQPPRQPMSTEDKTKIGIGDFARDQIERINKSRFDPNKPSAVMETERVNVQDPTLGGPPEREVPIPKERDTSPRGPAPFSPDERAMARDAFFEKMFSRADERKQSRAMDQEERENVRDARRDEAAMRGSERGRGIADPVGQENRRGNRNRRGRRMRRRDFTRKRSRMEGRRSREERAAFRDRFVSILR